MKWAEFAIKRKYTVFAFVLAVIIFGVFAKNTLKVELFPETNPPLVNVITGYPGVSAEDVARDLSEPLEEEFVTIPGVKKISSNSQDGLSVIKVEFHYGEDVDAKAVDVQNAISKIKRSLPAGIQEPQVMKFSSSDKPVMTISFSSSKVDLTNVRDLAEEVIAAREAITVAETTYEQIKRFYTPNVFMYREAQYKLEEAKVNFKQQEQETELKIRHAYLDLQSAEKAYKTLEASLASAEETYRVARLKFKAGVITRMEMEKAADNLSEQEAKVTEMLFNYNLAAAQFRYGLFMDSSADSTEMMDSAAMFSDSLN